MPIVDIQSALKAMHEKRYDGLYFVVGEERYFSNRCINHLRHAVVTGELSEFNEDLFYATEVNIEKLAESLQSLPVFSESRLVILREAQFLSDKDWSFIDEAYTPILQNLKNSSKPDCVFVIQASQLDRRKKVIKKLIEKATIIECETPQDASRAPWIRNLSNEKGLELDQEALAYMVQMGAHSLDELDRDLEKILLFFGGPHQVTIGDIANILQRSREEDIFSLSESIGKRDRTQSLFLFHRLISQGENEIALVSLVARHLRILLKILCGKEIGLKGAALATQAGINNYFLSNYSMQSQLWTKEEIAQSLILLAELDKQLKSSSLPGDLWFERFLLRI